MKMLLGAVALSLVACVFTPAFAQDAPQSMYLAHVNLLDGDMERLSLTGIGGMEIFVYNLNPKIEEPSEEWRSLWVNVVSPASGIYRSVFEIDVESALREHDITVLVMSEELFEEPGIPILFALVGATEVNDGLYMYTSRVALTQAVYLWRDPHSGMRAATWDRFSSGVVPAQKLAEAVRNAVKVMVADFIDDYLAANP